MAVKRTRTEEPIPVQDVLPAEAEEPTVTTPEPDTTEVAEPSAPQGLEETIRGLLSVPRTGGSIPTLTCIDKGIFKRYFILDVDGDAYGKAWKAYREAHPDGTPEEFVAIVLRILSQGMPRMHRAVSYVPLL